MMMDASALYAYTAEVEDGVIHFHETDPTDRFYEIVSGRQPDSILGDRLDEVA